MGQVIRLLRVGDRVGSFEEDTPDRYCDLSEEDLRQALSGCLEVRQQIGILLELTVEAEKIVDSVSDTRVQTQLREKKARSRVELIAALARISTTITALETMLSVDALPSSVGPEEEPGATGE